MRMNMAVFVLAILASVAGSWSASGARQSVPAIYVFGDSLFDVGNGNYLPDTQAKVNYLPYGIDYPNSVPTGRASNGYLAIDFVAMRLGFKKSPPAALSIKTAAQESRGVNFASGGSGVLDQTGKNLSIIPLNSQIKLFKDSVGRLEKLRGRRHARLHLSKSIFVFSTFNNDIFAFLSDNTPGLFNTTLQDRLISSLLSQFQKQLQRLYGLGARKIVLLGTGELGCTPAIRFFSSTGECVDIVNYISQKFNNAMKEKMKVLSSELRGLKYLYINTYDINAAILDHAAQYGFKEIKSACCGGGLLNVAIRCLPNSTYCSNRNEYLTWDAVHPTQANNKKIVDLAFSGPPFAEPITFQELVR